MRRSTRSRASCVETGVRRRTREDEEQPDGYGLEVPEGELPGLAGHEEDAYNYFVEHMQRGIKNASTAAQVLLGFSQRQGLQIPLWTDTHPAFK